MTDVLLAVVLLVTVLAMVWSHHRGMRQLLEAQDALVNAVLSLQNPVAAQVYANMQSQTAALRAEALRAANHGNRVADEELTPLG